MMIRLEMKNCNMILTDKLQRHQHYHHVNLINVNILRSEEILPSGQSQKIQQVKLTY